MEFENQNPFRVEEEKHPLSLDYEEGDYFGEPNDNSHSYELPRTVPWEDPESQPSTQVQNES